MKENKSHVTGCIKSSHPKKYSLVTILHLNLLEEAHIKVYKLFSWFINT